jgi:hypothetical protein
MGAEMKNILLLAVLLLLIPVSLSAQEKTYSDTGSLAGEAENWFR